MAATSVFSAAAVAAGASPADSSTVLTPPFRGITVQGVVTMAAPSTRGVYLMYATSIDGTNYNDFQTLCRIGGNGVVTEEFVKDILVYSTASNIIIRAKNQDPTIDCSSLTVKYQTFA